MNQKLILVTNDDGIFAPGLRALVGIAKKHGEVVVVAPNTPQSGMGHAITMNQPLRLHKLNHFDGIESYECSGTPVDCVKLAKNVLLKERNIDLCLSGINHGSNASINIIYSGTMSAAMEASLEQIPSIGFSLLDYSFDADFWQSEPFLDDLISKVLTNGIRACNLLNVNIPKLKRDEIKGLKVCRQAEGSWVEEFQEGKDPRNQTYYWLTGQFYCDDPGHDTDLWALENGYISVVPSGHDLTVHAALHQNHHLQTNQHEPIGN
ncbi:MAG: 5'/3'-nucleotidase SurE [Saprospiraceae bacterium]|nr:5'/3'-nucleotidase SurE [Saprospiraceae bacterium]